MSNHHYVPQTLLRNFLCDLKNEQIYVFDKQNERSFKTNIKNISCEKDFNEFEVSGEKISYEHEFSRIEGSATKIIQKIISEESLKNVSDDEKSELARFIALQRLRTKNSREVLKSIGQYLKNFFEEARVFNAETQKPSLDEKEMKIMGFRLLNNMQVIAPILVRKSWALLKTDESRPFYISDNPVTLQNMKDFGPFRGNLGFAVPGIEIYMPLSKILALSIVCPETESEIRNGYLKACLLFGRGHKSSIVVKTIREAERFISAIDRKDVWFSSEENVENFNYLQVYSAERFVMSPKSDFKLIQEMIKDDCKYKTGPRPIFN